MRRPGALAIGVVLLASGAAGMARASPLAFTGTLTIDTLLEELLITGETVPLRIDLSGQGVADVSASGGHLASLQLPGGAFTTDLVIFRLPMSGVSFVGISNQSGSFADLTSGPLAGGRMAVDGAFHLCVGPQLTGVGCLGFVVPFPLHPAASTGLGLGGSYTTTGYPGITMTHHPWTLGSTVVTWHEAGSITQSPVLQGFAHGPASLSSSTAQPSGVVQLVTATKVFTGLSAFPELPITATLRLQFVPEPGTLLLLGAGAGGVGLLGHRRRRRWRAAGMGGRRSPRERAGVSRRPGDSRPRPTRVPAGLPAGSTG